jgi:hypothetical protein
MNKLKEQKEDFCPACLVAIPMAFTGMGAAGYSKSKLSEKKQKKTRNMLLIIGIILTLLSYPVWKRMRRGCSSCSV